MYEKYIQGPYFTLKHEVIVHGPSMISLKTLKCLSQKLLTDSQWLLLHNYYLMVRDRSLEGAEKHRLIRNTLRTRLHSEKYCDSQYGYCAT